MKRFFDIFFSLIGIILLGPIIIIILILVWNNDKSWPLYVSNRVGLKGKYFKMIKIRTMVVDADMTGIDSTSLDDNRITKIGNFCRKYKLDELTQLINILFGDMSFVGPRPNVKREIDIYSNMELNLLSIKPGLTDFASIVFSDESKILIGREEPDISYNQLIRPGKSKLGLFYLKKNNIFIDFVLILITLVNLFSRKVALNLICKILFILKADNELIKIASRKFPLKPSPPPGSTKIVTKRY